MVKTKKICVYTCITGNYDNINEFFDYKEKNIDYYLFTNHHNIKSDFWHVVYVDEQLDNVRLARKIKILGHDILRDYDITVWIDGAMCFRQPVSYFLKKFCNMKMYSLIGFKHPDRDCIYDEAKACVIHGRDDKDVIIKEINFLISQNYPEHNGLIESAVLVRRNHDTVLDKTMHDWFSMILNYSYRDQLSFNYVAYKNNLKFKLLNMMTFDNDYFYRLPHSKKYDKRLIKYRVYFGDDTDLEKYSFDCDFSDYYQKVQGQYIINLNVPIDGEEIKVKLDSVGGIVVNHVDVDGINLNGIEYVHNTIYFGKNFFWGDNPTFIIHGSYKKNEKVVIKIDMCVVSEEEYLFVIDSLFGKVRSLTKEKEELIKKNCSLNNDIDKVNQDIEKHFVPIEQKYNNIVNSRFWKITFPFRFIRRKLKILLKGVTNEKN